MPVGARCAVKRAKGDGIKAYFFVDLLVFPTPVLAAWPNASSGGEVQWNDATRQLMQVLVDETFARFPGCDGWIVRTGETYTYDTPFHVRTCEHRVVLVDHMRTPGCFGRPSFEI